MPRRIIDGDAIWESDKLATCVTKIPATVAVYYPWFYCLADANGSFEMTNVRVIHSKVAVNLPFLKKIHVEIILKEFEENGLLFVWKQNGKRYGHWSCSDKDGRLPPASIRDRYGKNAPPVPSVELSEYEDKWRPGLDKVKSESGQDLDVDLDVDLDWKGKEQAAPLAPAPLAHPLSEIWQQEHGPLPRVLELDSTRLRKCRLRMKNHASDPERFLADFRHAVRKAVETPFLRGENDRGWKVNFDWFITNDCNYLKILEGKYEGNGITSANRKPAGAVDKPAGKQYRKPTVLEV